MVELNPPGTALRAFIAQLAQRQGRLDDALSAMQGVLAQPGGDIPAMRRLAGEMELQAGRPDQAVAHLRLALAHWPADRRTLHALLSAWERLGAVDDARDTLTRRWPPPAMRTTCGWPAWRWSRWVGRRRRR